MSTLSTTNLKNPSSGSNNIVLDSSGRALVGTSTARSNLYAGSLTAALQVEGTTYSTSSFSMIANGSGSALSPYPIFYLGRSRGASVGSNTIVENADNIGSIVFTGADGTNLIPTAAIECFVDGTPGANDMPGRLVFSTTADGAASPTERVRIDSSGNLLFNTTSVIDASDVSAVIKVGRNFATIRAPDTNTYMAFQFQNNSGTRVGFIQFTTTATTFSTSSDYRLKENVVAVNDGIARLRQLKPSRFNFIADSDKTVDGFLAHEVQDIVPEAIQGIKDAVDADGNPVYQGIDQSKLVPLLTAALQEAIAKIETLEARLTAAGIA